ncbi:MAG: hypothetical protein VKO21_05575 [Candidatus Sericytochromatia bacterium]|nr:hypothetical protein [Candidatus Sericytochromatia bacterium]
MAPHAKKQELGAIDQRVRQLLLNLPAGLRCHTRDTGEIFGCLPKVAASLPDTSPKTFKGIGFLHEPVKDTLETI